MRKTAKEAMKTRECILQHALKVFGKQGFAATKLTDVAKEAGITRGAIYHHFNNKIDLFHELAEKYRTKITNHLEQIYGKNLAPISKLKKLLKGYFELLETDEGLGEFEKLHLLKLEITNLYDTDCKKVQSFFQNNLQLISKLIQEGINNGDVKKDINPEEFAWFLFAYVGGILRLWTFFDRPFILSEKGSKYIDMFLDEQLLVG